MASLKDRFQRMLNPPEDEYEDYYDDEPQETQPEEEPRRSVISRFESRESRSAAPAASAKGRMQMVVRRPSTFGEEVRDIADELLERHTVVLILERADRETSRRIVDFLSGVAYANHGQLRPIASNIVIVAPYNVDLSGDDVLDELESSGIYF